MRLRPPGAAALLAACWAAAAGAAAAQDPPPRPDSLARSDSVYVTERDIRSIVPFEVPPGPLPPGTRYVFPRDSLQWLAGYTLADLLATIPGAYPLRTGFIIQPEPVAYAGRGADAIEIFWDGVPLLPLGPDSLHVDPARISLFGLRRVEVEVLPAALRVYLVTERHARPEARSLVRIVSGDFRTAGYAGLFQYQFANGLSLNLRGDFLSTEGDRQAQRDDAFFDLWAKVDWAPAPTMAASWQVRRQDYDRDAVTGAGDVATAGRDGRRTDQVFRLVVSQAADRMGAGAEAGLAVSSWTQDSLVPDRTVRQAFLGTFWRGRSATIGVTGRVSDGHYLAGADGRVGWVPLPFVVLAGDASARWYPDDRTARRANGSVGLFAGPVSLVGAASAGDLVAAPLIPGDTVQQTTDLAGHAGLALGRLGGRVGLARRDPWLPLVPDGLEGIGGVTPTEQTTYLTADVRLQPFRTLTVDAWYANPIEGAVPDFQPPEHGRVALTFRSNFFQTFRSGAFDLKVSYGLEFWSAWTAGLGTQGTPIAVPGATFHHFFLQFRIVGFKAFYSLGNARNSRGRYVPGLDTPRAVQTFGVKWEFAN